MKAKNHPATNGNPTQGVNGLEWAGEPQGGYTPANSEGSIEKIRRLDRNPVQVMQPHHDYHADREHGQQDDHEDLHAIPPFPAGQPGKQNFIDLPVHTR